MKSKRAGKIILKVKNEIEISAITKSGIWIIVSDFEYFLSFEDYPWFKGARIEDVFKVEWFQGGHLYWPDLDIDLMVDGLTNKEKYPLISKA